MSNKWWNSLTAGEQIGYGFGILFITGLIVAYFVVEIYRRGYEEGWAKGYVRGKTVASERHID
jgi:hypothetical protein